jgi:glycosyltransferase involved in cell wall biosynthesis
MNVIFVMNAYHPIIGGVEKVASCLARELKKLDCRVEVVTARNPISLPASEIIDGIPVHRFPYYIYRGSFKSTAAMFIGMPIACFQLLYLALKLRPCIVHVHFIYHNAVCVVLISKILRKLRIPIVVTFHGGDAPNIPKDYYERNPSESTILDWAVRNLLEKAYALTSVSDSKKQLLLDTKLPGVSAVKVIHNGVDTDAFAPQKNVREEKRVLAIGRLTYQKGFDILLETFANIAEKNPEWELRIAGDGELRNSLYDQTVSLGINNRVKFLGMIATEQIVTEINSAAFVVSSSRWEGFSLAALEVMSCGKALITTDVEGSGEMLINGLHGIIVPKENPTALEQAMEHLMERPEKCLQMGKQAREHIASNFTWEQVARQYRDLYKDVLCSKRRNSMVGG